MRKCSNCGSTNLRMQVPILINTNAEYESRITKKVISSKETEIIAASWDRMIITCKDCGKVIVDMLDKLIKKCQECEHRKEVK